MLTEVLVAAAAEAVFGYLLEQSGVMDRVRGNLGRDPQQLAFKVALTHTLEALAQRHPSVIEGALFDATFLGGPAAPLLAQLLVRDGNVTATALVEVWADHLGLTASTRQRHLATFTSVAEFFLRTLDEELRKRPEFQALIDSQVIDRIDDTTEATGLGLAALRQELTEALQQLTGQLEEVAKAVHIEGDANASILVTGSHNRAFQTIIQNYPRLREYAYDFNELITSTTQWFVGREAIFTAFKQFQARHRSGYFRIAADAGLGKTAIAAQLARLHNAPAFFVSASQGLTRPDQCLNHLSAEIIAKYQLPHDQLPPRPGEDSAFLSLLLKEVVEANRGPLVVVVDALDEADDPSSGRNPLLLPSSLPPGVFFVLTHRPGDYPFSTDPRTAIDTFAIRWDDAFQQDDVSKYLYQQLQRPELHRALNEVDLALPTHRVVSRLLDASEGNFMYLAYVLADIEAGQSGLHPLDLDSLPQGLMGYYSQFWSYMEEEKREDYDEWRNLFYPVIMLLGAAGEPIKVQWLADHIGRDPIEVRERALLRWQRFLRREYRNDVETWSIVHQSFADFLAIKGDFRDIHRRIAVYYQEEPKHWDEHDSYAYRHLSTHLATAGMFDEFAALIERQDWYEAQHLFDPTLSTYTRDVERALTLAEQQEAVNVPQIIAWSLLYASLLSRASEIPVEALETMVLLGEAKPALRYVDLFTNLEKQAYTLQRFGMQLQRQGQSQRARELVNRAIELCEYIQGEWRRAMLLASIGASLTEMGETARAHQILARALGEAGAIGDERLRSHAMTEIVRRLAQAQDHATLTALLYQVAEREETLELGGAVTALLQATSSIIAQTQDPELLQLVLQSVERLEPVAHRAQALAALAQCFDQIGATDRARELINQSLTLTLNSSDEDVPNIANNLDMICETVLQVENASNAAATTLANTIVESIGEIQDSRKRVEVLSVVAYMLYQSGNTVYANELLERAKDAADSLTDAFARAWAYYAIARSYFRATDIPQTQKTLHEALQSIMMKGNIDWFFQALLAGIVFIQAELKDQNGLLHSLRVAENITLLWVRRAAVAQITLVFAQIGNETKAHELLNQVLQDTVAGDTIEFEVRALSALTTGLFQEGSISQACAAFHQGWQLVEAADDEWKRSDAIEMLLKALPENQSCITWERALRAIERTQHEWLLDQPLLTLASLYPESEERAVVIRALELAASIKRDTRPPHAHVLAAMTRSAVHVGEVDRALEIADNVEYVATVQPQVFSGIALALIEKGEIDRALACVERVQYVSGQIEVLVAIVQKLALLGQIERALDLLPRIYRPRQGPALQSLAYAMIQAKRVAEAHETLMNLMELLTHHSGTETRVRMQADVANMLIQIGEADQGWDVLLQALDLGEEIGQGQVWDRMLAHSALKNALITMIQAMVDTGDLSGIRRIRTVSERMREYLYCSIVLANTAHALAQLGDTAQAADTFAQALQTAMQIYQADWRGRAHALSVIAKLQVEVGYIEQGRKVLHSALEESDDAQIDNLRADALAQVGAQLAEIPTSHQFFLTQAVIDVLRSARGNGRKNVWLYVAAFSPVFVNLGIISSIWDHIQTIEQLLGTITIRSYAIDNK